MSIWKISNTAGTWETATAADAAGIANIQRHLVANGQDTLTFTIPAALALTADVPYTYKTEYIIWRDGVRYFRGLVTSIPRDGSDQEETATIELSGPWWYLVECTYMQTWRIYDEGGTELTNVNKSRIILYQDADGNRITTGAQAEDVIDWLITKGAPITKGTIDAGITLPFDERTNLKCADIIDNILRWTPDYTMWFDYSTATPTIHFRSRANLTAASVAVAGGDDEKIHITPRYDLQKPGIHLTYERTVTVDEDTWNTVVTDTAGTTDAIDTIFGVFELRGVNISHHRQKIVTENIPDWTTIAEADLKTWWKNRVSWISDIAAADITIHTVTVDAGISSLPRILIEGNVQEWMAKTATAGAIRTKADITIRDASDAIVEIRKNVALAVNITATDAATGTYTTVASVEDGEPTPTGVATALNAAWSTLHYEGLATLAQAECTGAATPGKKLNLTGGRTSWATMNAIIQETVENIEEGVTTITFGPSPLVEADTLVALFRALRGRQYAWHREARTTGKTSSISDVETGGLSPDSSQSSGGGETERLDIRAPDGELTHHIDNDPSAITFDDVGDKVATTIKPRESIILVKDINGNIQTRLAQVMAGAAYGTAVTIIPDIPATGTHVLVSDDGVLSWAETEAFTCPV